MVEPTMQTLERRLDRVERENRRLKQVGVVVLAVIAAVMLMGHGAPRKVAKVVEAEKFVLRDADGRVRGRLHTKPDGTAGLSLLDKGGTRRIALSVSPKGSGFEVYEKTGPLRALLGLASDGTVGLVLNDKLEKRSIALYAGSDWLPMLKLLGSKEEVYIELSVLSDGPSLNLRGVRGSGARLVAESDRLPSLTLSDKGGKVIWSTGAGMNGWLYGSRVNH